ncbi:DNA cytosine methyltransferase [Altererythrobacter sp. RZ02]|uniref:DNA (cytosine-5-)-methyltransferase n=1 Tax=Pontixanthobacter rizhaonensis TaxID=2730337 RepID=A0A848QQA1_9SPHN|nr:DNA cytosine methyltransferase [Pontixanthobacter rizhaonensis]NMW32757.1 DNA cytosine methyltransferase [Pontixanthobacter rizhaonensis]
MPSFYEFFSGGGMARAGLGRNWKCLFANDNDPAKADIYEANWGADSLDRRDVAEIGVADLWGIADLAWASFPCQDLSLAGNGAGLSGNRSSAFWQFWSLIADKARNNEHPKIIVLENVMGAVTSHHGNDFRSICESLHEAGYRLGALMLDASAFLPQSRRRLFIVGVRADLKLPEELYAESAVANLHTKSIIDAVDKLEGAVRKSWIWWAALPSASKRHDLADYVGTINDPNDWHSADQTRRLIELMDDNNREKLSRAQKDKLPQIGALYKRMRKDTKGCSIQRAEIRFDGLVGCLRVPLGGSSKQTLIFVDRSKVRTRLLTPLESAKLMGLASDFVLPESATETYHLTGDGVAVPVVSFIRDEVIQPILQANETSHDPVGLIPSDSQKGGFTPELA